MFYMHTQDDMCYNQVLVSYIGYNISTGGIPDMYIHPQPVGHLVLWVYIRIRQTIYARDGMIQGTDQCITPKV